MNDVRGAAVSEYGENTMKAMEAAYDVICLEQPEIKMNNLTIEYLIYRAVLMVELTDSDGCNEYKAGFRIYFYLLPMIF